MHHRKNSVKSFVKSNMHALCQAKEYKNTGKISYDVVLNKNKIQKRFNWREIGQYWHHKDNKTYKIFVSAVQSGVSASSSSSQGKKAFQSGPDTISHKMAPSHRPASRKLIMRVV
jgi:hypothetical protein